MRKQLASVRAEEVRLLKAAEVHEADAADEEPLRVDSVEDESPKVQPLGARILAGLGLGLGR